MVSAVYIWVHMGNYYRSLNKEIMTKHEKKTLKIVGVITLLSAMFIVLALPRYVGDVYTEQPDPDYRIQLPTSEERIVNKTPDFVDTTMPSVNKLPWVDVTNVPSKDEVRIMIIEAAEARGVDPELAVRIAECESGLDPFASNPHSTASGVFQITKATFEDAIKLQFTDWVWYSVFDAHKNIEVAMWYMSENQYWRWNASQHCWNYDL